MSFTGQHSFETFGLFSQIKTEFALQTLCYVEEGGTEEKGWSNKALRPKETSVKLFKQLWFCIQTGKTEVLHDAHVQPMPSKTRRSFALRQTAFA